MQNSNDNDLRLLESHHALLDDLLDLSQISGRGTLK